LLKKHAGGLTRQQIINLMKLTDQEIKRVSTCLSRAVKRGFLYISINEDKKSVFCLQQNIS